MLIQVGAAETLLDDAVRLAVRAGAADVAVTLEVWPEMIHVWHIFHPQLAAGAAPSPPPARSSERVSPDPQGSGRSHSSAGA